jgi:hypothetical protein
MSESRFGTQPAQALLREQRWSVAAAAREICVTYPQLRGAVIGWSRPTPAVRDGLSKLLDKPVEELFTAEALAPRKSQ